MCAGGGCSAPTGVWLDNPAVAGVLNGKELVCRDRTGDGDVAAPGFGVYVNVNPVA